MAFINRGTSFHDDKKYKKAVSIAREAKKWLHHIKDPRLQKGYKNKISAGKNISSKKIAGKAEVTKEQQLLSSIRIPKKGKKKKPEDGPSPNDNTMSGNSGRHVDDDDDDDDDDDKHTKKFRGKGTVRRKKKASDPNAMTDEDDEARQPYASQGSYRGPQQARYGRQDGRFKPPPQGQPHDNQGTNWGRQGWTDAYRHGDDRGPGLFGRHHHQQQYRGQQRREPSNRGAYRGPSGS